MKTPLLQASTFCLVAFCFTEIGAELSSSDLKMKLPVHFTVTASHNMCSPHPELVKREQLSDKATRFLVPILKDLGLYISSPVITNSINVR